MKKMLYLIMLVLLVAPASAAQVIYRIDDITLCKNDLPLVAKAIIVAEKYDIRFDLAVMAQPLNECKGGDADVRQLISANSERVRIVAHGYTHLNPVCGAGYYGEFYDPGCTVSNETQAQKFNAMRNVFTLYDLPDATKILYLPGSRYDANTITLANQYGYEILTGYPSPTPRVLNQLFGSTWVDSGMIAVSQTTNTPYRELRQEASDLSYLKSLPWQRIYVVLHPQNVQNQKNLEQIVRMLK